MNSQYALEALYPKDDDSMPVICQLIAERKDERSVARDDAMKFQSWYKKLMERPIVSL